ncbi:MAG: metallophosphoesterase [Clostridia bacterium]|nr:metallophosphoesterase [Clostridia bacterium]
MKKTFKKVLCVILAVAVVAVGIPFSAIASTKETVDFAILSDTHYFAESSMGETAEDKQEFVDMMLLNNSTTGLAPNILDAALANLALKAKNGEIEFVLMPGDLTRNAEYAAHKEQAEKLAKFEAETGIPIFVINGNHDINNQRSMYYDGENLITSKKNPALRDEIDTSPEEFEALYKDFGFTAEGDGYYSRYKEKADNSEGSLSYAVDINDNYRLIALDAMMYSPDTTDSGEAEQETGGKMSEKFLAWAVAETEKAVKDGKTVIGMCHNNIIPHMETQVDILEQFVLFNWQEVADALAKAGMNYVVSGHSHMQDVASYVTDSGDEVHEITTSSILSFPNQFRTVTMDTYATGRVECEYRTHDVDETIPVYINGVAQEQPFSKQTWKYNFGGDDIKNFVTNLLQYQLRYGFGKDVKDAGGLYKYLISMLDFNELMTDLIGNEILGGVTATAIKGLLRSLCNQLENAYLTDYDATVEKVSEILDTFLDLEISDYPSTAFKDTLGFGSEGDKGTISDLASTVLANHTANNEDPKNDKFLQSALERFDNGENAELIVDCLFHMILEELLVDNILKEIKIDPISLGLGYIGSDYVDSTVEYLNNLIGTDGLLSLSLTDVVSIILTLGIFDGDTVTDVVYSFLDEYLTESQYDIIDQEFYRIMKDFTHDENPGYMADHEGKFVVDGPVDVPLSQKNLRLPSHISVSLGEDASTEMSISYYTKYSITDTDVQIVPYSEKPDFSKGTTVDAEIETKCDVETLREWPAIDIGFIGILYHKEYVNRHCVTISGLEPNTKYCYRLGDADRGWWSETGVINTADNSDEFSFFHMTDPQSTTEKQYEEVFAPALDFAVNAHDGDFILGTGDFVDDGRSFIQWQRMFNSTNTFMNIPVMGVAGNHESKGDNALDNYFTFPNAPEQDRTLGVFYSFDYNNAHFAVLDSNKLGADEGLSPEQIEWLKADMNASDADWKFVALHKAPYSNGSHYDDDDVIAIRAQLQSLMPELGIDIVFQGHDHVFMRSDVLNNNEIVETETENVTYNGLEYTAKVNPDGTIYSINGTIGVKHYKAKPESETSKLMPNGETVLYLEVPSYSYIQIDGDMLYFDSYAIEGDKETRVDQFAIRKDLTDKPVVDEPTTDEPTTDTPVTPDEPTTDKPVVDKPATDNDVVTDNPQIPNTSTSRKDMTPVYIVAFMLLSAGLVVLTLTKKKRRSTKA